MEDTASEKVRPSWGWGGGGVSPGLGMADRGHKYSREGYENFQGLTETGDWLKVTQLLPGGARTPLR